MNFLEQVEFNVMQPTGVNVVAFGINFTKEEQWKDISLCTLEKLDCTETASGGRIQKTFAIPYSEEEISNVVILSLAKTRCVIGYGTVENNLFKSANETIQLNYMNYSEAEVNERNYTFTYNPKRQIVLLDADDGKQVMPVISKPDVFGNLMGKYALTPYKRYIALELSLNVKLSGDKKNMEDIGNIII